MENTGAQPLVDFNNHGELTDGRSLASRLSPEEKLDAVMRQVQTAINADPETQLLNVWMSGPGVWCVGTDEGEELQFLMGHELESLVVTELFRDNEPVEDSVEHFDVNTLTVREALTEIVDQIGYGNVSDLEESLRRAEAGRQEPSNPFGAEDWAAAKALEPSSPAVDTGYLVPGSNLEELSTVCSSLLRRKPLLLVSPPIPWPER